MTWLSRRGLMKGAAGMVWWPGGNARQRLGPQAREAQRPDRRVLGVTRAGTGPAPSQSIFIGNLVIVHGTGPTSGVFIYNGAPGLGNPPQIAIVPTGVTQDPYGNAITSSKILMQGNVITEAGGIFKTAVSPPLIQLDGPHNAVLVYDASSVLRETIAPVATNDGFGTAVPAGFVAYATGLFAQLQAAALSWGGTAITAPAVIGSNSSDAHLQLSSGQTAGNTVEAILNLLTAAAGGVSTVQVTSGALELTEGAVPAADASINAGPKLFGTTAGHLKIVADSLHGDGNTYGTERAIQQVSPTSQTISSTTGQNITGLSWPVIAGTYIVRARLIMEWNAAAGTPQMQFTGPAVSRYDVSFKTRQSGSSSTANTNSLVAAAAGNGTGYNSGLINQTQAMTAAGIFFDVDIWGVFTFTAAGTLNLSAATTVAADTWIMFSGFWEIQPL